MHEAAGPGYSGSDWAYYLDGGECRSTVGSTTHTHVAYEIVWEGSGASWNCPFSKSTSTLAVRVANTDRFRWHVEASGGADVDIPLLAKIKLSLSGNVDDENVKTVDGGITQAIEAGYCHKVYWHAVFLADKVKATAKVYLERRWRWWVKRSGLFESTVYASGDIWMPCATYTVELARLEPFQLHIALDDSACPDCSNVRTVGRQGWWPPLPDGLPPIDPYPPPPTNPDPDPDPDSDEEEDDGTCEGPTVAPPPPPPEPDPTPPDADPRDPGDGPIDGDEPDDDGSIGDDSGGDPGSIGGDACLATGALS
jgi:hypothetical protein